MTIYRGYIIQFSPQGGFIWTDERHENVSKAPFKTEEEAMNDIDRYKKEIAQANLRRGT